MSNLIVTILALGLISALSVAAINYSGSVYMEARSDGQAAEIVAQANKVANAMRSWTRASRSTTFTDTNWADGTAADLSENNNRYLDALPRLGEYALGLDGGTDYYFKAMPLATTSITGPDNEGVNFSILISGITSMPVCKAIARLSRGDTAAPRFRNVSGATLGDFSTPMSVSDFDCVVNDANNNSTLDSGESMFFIYKVL
jgi:hypothetical protein